MQTPWHGTLRQAGKFVGVMSLAALLFTACGNNGNGGNGGTGGGVKGPMNALVNCPTSTNTSAAKAETGNITLNVSGWASTPAEDALVQKGFSEFEAKYPNIKINWQTIPGDYATKMRANAASNNLPDVFYLQPPMSQEYIPSGKLLNLSPYMQRDNVQASDFYDAIQQPFDCKDGTVFGIPKDLNTLGLFYNKDMFTAAGLGDPSNWSWSDLQDAAKKLTSGSTVGLSIPGDPSRWGAFLFAGGGSMLSSDGKKAAFNDSKGVDAANFYTSFYGAGTGKRPADLGADWDGTAFGRGQAAMTFEGGWMIPFMTSTYPNIHYAVAPLPKAPNGQKGNLVFTNAWGASASTQHADAAAKLIEFMTDTSYETEVLQSGFAIPSRKALASNSYFTQNPNVKVLLDGVSYAHADFYGPADTKIHSELGTALDSVALGKASVQSALNTAADNVNTFIEQNTAP